jgi:hypothetical protein
VSVCSPTLLREQGFTQAVLPGEGTIDSTLGLENWVSLDHGSAPDLFYPYMEQAYFSDQPEEYVEGFITTNLRPSNSSEWVTVFGGESGNNTRLTQNRGLTGASESRHRKQNKCVGSSKTNLNFTLGDDLTLSGVAEMADKTLVGKDYGRQFSEKSLKSWAATNWDATYNPPPKISRMSRGWFMLVFSEKSQATTVLQKSWFIDSSLILLKLWNPTFDMLQARDWTPYQYGFGCQGLPPHLWNEKCFQAIGNFLGNS